MRSRKSTRHSQVKSDVTIFPVKDLAVVPATRAKTSITEDTAEKSLIVEATQKTNYSDRQNIDDQRSIAEFGCILRKKSSREHVTESLLRAMESEIDRHTMEVKQANQKLSSSALPDNNDAKISPGGVYGGETLPQERSPLRPYKKTLVSQGLPPTLVPHKANRITRRAAQKKLRNYELAEHQREQRESVSNVLKLNPFKIDPSLDLLDLREMVQRGRGAKAHMPSIIEEGARAQYQIFNDSRLLAPAFKFRHAAQFSNGKLSTEYDFDGPGVRLKQSKPQFRFRNIEQLLAVTRKNRKMQQETRQDIVDRVRETNRCNISMVIKRRMIDFLNESLAKFDYDITTVEEETEDIAKEFDAYLRESDDKTIKAIQRAETARTLRLATENDIERLEVQNNLLECHNIRKEDKVNLVDRAINTIYAVLPAELKTETLENHARYNGAAGTRGSADGRMYCSKRSLEESLSQFQSLSTESELDSNFISDSNSEKEVPFFPLNRPQDLIPFLEAYYESCQICLGQNADAKYQIKLLQQDVENLTKAGEETVIAAERRCAKLQKQVADLESKIGDLASALDGTREGPRNRTTFRKPLDDLRVCVRDLHAMLIDRSAPSATAITTSTMIESIRKKADIYTSDFARFPQTWLRRWYNKVDKDRQAENNLLEVVRKNPVEKGRKTEEPLHERSGLVGAAPRRQLRPRSVPPDHGKTTVENELPGNLLEEIVFEMLSSSAERNKWRESSQLPIQVESVEELDFVDSELAMEDTKGTTKKQKASNMVDETALKAIAADDMNESPEEICELIATGDLTGSETVLLENPIPQQIEEPQDYPFISAIAYRQSISLQETEEPPMPDVPHERSKGSEAGSIIRSPPLEGQELLDDFFKTMGGDVVGNQVEEAKLGQFRKSRASAESRRRSSKVYDATVATSSTPNNIESLPQIVEASAAEPDNSERSNV